MKFGRYASYVRDSMICIGVVFAISLSVIIYFTVKDRNYILMLAVIFLSLLSMLTFYLAIAETARILGGRLSDYIVFTPDLVELHSKEQMKSIRWSEVVEIRQIIPHRGIRQVKIIARDGTIISFASSGGREQQIWKIHPELQRKCETGFIY